MPEHDLTELEGALDAARRLAGREADRISFDELGRRRDEIARRLSKGEDIQSASARDEAYLALQRRRDALRGLQGELEARIVAMRALVDRRGGEIRPSSRRPSATGREDEPAPTGPDDPLAEPGIAPVKPGKVGRPKGRSTAALGQAALAVGALAGITGLVWNEHVRDVRREFEAQAPRVSEARYSGVFLPSPLLDSFRKAPRAAIFREETALRAYFEAPDLRDAVVRLQQELSLEGGGRSVVSWQLKIREHPRAFLDIARALRKERGGPFDELIGKPVRPIESSGATRPMPPARRPVGRAIRSNIRWIDPSRPY